MQASVARRGLRVAALLVAVGSRLAAQEVPVVSTGGGLYYKEVRKDGRIYVFNNPAEAERFEKSGELGRAITRVGVGPDGETVVGDNETALELFFFKYGIAEPMSRPKQPIQRIEWRDGKTRISTDNAYLEISNRVQVRYTHEEPDDSITLPGTAAAGNTRDSFRIRRAKLKLEGWVWKPALTYELQVNWPGVTGSNTGALLEDAAIDFDLTKGKNRFRLRFGQFKVPFGHQELVSSGSQSFVDRSIVSNEFLRGRDTGLALWGQINNKWEYRAGVFNGNGLTRANNDNDELQYNARLVWQPNGSVNLNQRAWVTGALYSEADFESTDRPIYWFAANFETNDLRRTTTGNDLKSTIYGLDFGFMYHGFYATAEYFQRERKPETGAEFDSDGWFGQLHYLLGQQRKWEVAVRYAEFDPNDAVTLNKLEETGAALSYYLRRHNLKMQLDLRELAIEGTANSGRGVENQELRFQTQINF